MESGKREQFGKIIWTHEWSEQHEVKVRKPHRGWVMKDGLLYIRPLLKAELVAYFLGMEAAREEFELGCNSDKLHRRKSGLNRQDTCLTLLQLNETQTGGRVKSHSSDKRILNWKQVLFCCLKYTLSVTKADVMDVKNRCSIFYRQAKFTLILTPGNSLLLKPYRAKVLILHFLLLSLLLMQSERKVCFNQYNYTNRTLITHKDYCHWSCYYISEECYTQSDPLSGRRNLGNNHRLLQQLTGRERWTEIAELRSSGWYKVCGYVLINFENGKELK